MTNYKLMDDSQAYDDPKNIIKFNNPVLFPFSDDTPIQQVGFDVKRGLIDLGQALRERKKINRENID